MSNVTDEYVRRLVEEMLKRHDQPDTPRPGGYANIAKINEKVDQLMKDMGEKDDESHRSPLLHPLSPEGLAHMFFLVLTLLILFGCFYCKNRECLERMCKRRDRRGVLLGSDLLQ